VQRVIRHHLDGLYHNALPAVRIDLRDDASSLAGLQMA
jgi:hypothetical protein